MNTTFLALAGLALGPFCVVACFAFFYASRMLADNYGWPVWRGYVLGTFCSMGLIIMCGLALVPLI